MKNSKINKSGKTMAFKTVFKAIIFGFAISIIVSLLLLGLMSLIVYKIGIPTALLQYLAVFCGGVGAFFGATVTGYITNENGLAIGAIMGVVIIMVLFLINIFANNMTLGANTFIKYIIILALAIFGGIFGVNKSNSTIKHKY